MQLGAQLFGSMKLYHQDPDAFLSALAAAGYTQVEPCVGLGEMALPFAWPQAELAAHVSRAADKGLGVDSCHVFAAAFWEAVPAMAAVAREHGFRRFVVGWRGAIEREAVDRFARRCRETALALEKEGLALWLHNNAAEIAAKIDGLSAYEYILRACEGHLGAQVDTGWVAVGGEDVAAFLERNAPFVRSIHHKDLAALTDDPIPANVALGRGIVDPRVAYGFAAARGLGQIVDQDNSLGDIREDLAASAEFLLSL